MEHLCVFVLPVCLFRQKRITHGCKPKHPVWEHQSEVGTGPRPVRFNCSEKVIHFWFDSPAWSESNIRCVFISFSLTPCSPLLLVWFFLCVCVCDFYTHFVKVCSVCLITCIEKPNPTASEWKVSTDPQIRTRETDLQVWT